MREKNCPFCDTSIGDTVFARSQNFLAIYNIAPVLPGHTLIIPRNHYESVLDLQDEELAEMIRFAREVTGLLMKVFSADAFNWAIQDKEIAGQSIAHVHLHVVLRYPGDFPDPGDWYPRIKENYDKMLDSASRERLKPEEMYKIVRRLRDSAQSLKY